MPRFLVYVKNLYCVSNVRLFRHFRQVRRKQRVNVFIDNRVKQLRSSIIQNEISEIGKIKPHVREVDLNADNKRFWLGRLVDINDKKSNNSASLNHEFFPERFELNDDF